MIQSPTKIVFIIVAILLTSICSKAQPPIQVEIDFSKARSLQKSVYGINNEFVTRPYTQNSKNYKAVFDEQLGRPTFRYPAGTPANFLDPETGKLGAWATIDDAAKDRLDGFRTNLTNSGKDKVDVQEFIQFMKEKNPVCNYVLNVTPVDPIGGDYYRNNPPADTKRINANRKLLTEIRDSGVVVNHFELGNELFYGSYATAFRSVKQYIANAKATADMVREVFPNAKVAVGVPAEYFTHESFLDGPPDSGNRLELWYDALKNETFYDAIVVHLYSEIGMNNQTTRDQFISFRNAYNNVISHIDNRTKPSFDRMKVDFPGKEIWVTEYHVGGFAGDVRQYKLRNTYLGALSCANFMLKIFAEPEAKLSNWHSMMQFLLYPNPGKGNMLDENTPFTFDLNYHFFKTFKEPVLNSTQYVPVDLSGVPTYSAVGKFTGNSYNVVDAGVFYNEKEKLGYLMIVNKRQATYLLNSVLQLGDNLHKAVIQSCTELAPDAASMATYDKNGEEPGGITKNGVIINDIVVGEEALTLKPYSMYVIKFKVECK